jgi:hypothetical protein
MRNAYKMTAGNLKVRDLGMDRIILKRIKKG